ncbi:Clp protease N-terminal domain-containing protein [Nocardioides marinquilinus]|uniref:Clp protease N-terminal domain-containing protein n=1 Tax=Nocardioides marinquilinus TaxID=1210400 RepID=A0ABP9PGC5_9ACTN
MAYPSLPELVRSVEAAAPGAPPLRRLTLAVLAADELGRTADDLVGHFVGQAREAGLPWAEIGAAMGVTKQAAQQRHVQRAQGADDDLASITGLDDAARAALEHAPVEALALWHHFVGTEHLVVAVLRTQGTLAEAVGCTAEDAVATAVAIVDRGATEPPTAPQLTARARKTLDLAALVATERGHDLVTPADLLLGVVREGRGIGAQVLDQRGGGLDAVRERLLSLPA